MRLASQECVPVTGDDWYERRREDAEGQFFRRVADQGPRKGEGGNTRQGLYLFTASGKLLAYSHHHQDPNFMRGVLQRGLQEWRNLPAAQRRPGAIQIEASGQPDPHFSRTPPEGGLIVNVYTRILDHTTQGDWCKGSCATPGGDLAARDHLWLTAAEIKSLVPQRSQEGDQLPVPAGIAERILRFHLVDNTRGEPPLWRREELRSQRLTLTVEEVTSTTVRLRLDGSALLMTETDVARSERGFEVRLLGYLQYDRTKKAITRFDVVALGEHWGQGPYTRGARSGRSPLGVAFEMARGDSAADQVPPQGARELEEYFGRWR
jgi:hypothetical protein